MKPDAVLNSLVAIGPQTRVEICTSTGMSSTYVRGILLALRKSSPRRIRICDWRKSEKSGQMLAVYEIGNAGDVAHPCPPALPGYGRMIYTEADDRQRLERARKQVHAYISGLREPAGPWDQLLKRPA